LESNFAERLKKHTKIESLYGKRWRIQKGKGWGCITPPKKIGSRVWISVSGLRQELEKEGRKQRADHEYDAASTFEWIAKALAKIEKEQGK